MTDTNITLEPRVREAIQQLRDLPDSLEAEDDPAFTVEQVNFLEKRLYEVRALLEGEDRSQAPIPHLHLLQMGPQSLRPLHRR